nr:SPOR domain-containing protein [uncultured Holophaga sp.]
MLNRDAQNLTISRQGLLLVTAMGVGLLTLVYVLGVQVGKQSASLHHTSSRASGDELTELPAPLDEQIKPFEAKAGSEKPPAPPAPSAQPEPAKPEEKPEEEAKPREEPKPKPKEEAKPKETPKPKADPPGKWSLQLVSTTDPQEAARVVAKAKAAGYHAIVVKEKKLQKVRLSKPMSREAADSAAKSLKSKGLKPFAVKAD